jgi:hypothetical protein
MLATGRFRKIVENSLVLGVSAVRRPRSPLSAATFIEVKSSRQNPGENPFLTKGLGDDKTLCTYQLQQFAVIIGN